MQDLLIGQKIQPEVITFLVIHKIKKNEAKKVFLFKKIFFFKIKFQNYQRNYKDT